MDRNREEAKAVKALADKLRTTSPLFGAPSQPQPAARAVAPPAPPPTFGLVNVMYDLDDALREQRLAREAEARRAADPVEQQAARLDALTHKLNSDEIASVRECLDLARTNDPLASAYLDEVRNWLNDAEQYFKS